MSDNDSTTPTSKYPFDAEHYQKGDIVQIEVIEKAFGVVRDTKEFYLKSLAAKSHIIRTFAARGETVTVAQQDGVMKILTDQEQVEYNSAEFDAGIRSSKRAHSRMLGADRSRITGEDLEVHDRRIEVQGRVLSAVARERNMLRPAPVERQTPALGANTGEPSKSDT